MRDFIHFLASSLVEDKESVVVDAVEQNGKEVLKLSVNKDELGKVIGKKGKTISAMRTLLYALGAKQNKKIHLEIVEPNGEDKKKADEQQKETKEPKQEE